MVWSLRLLESPRQPALSRRPLALEAPQPWLVPLQTWLARLVCHLWSLLVAPKRSLRIPSGRHRTVSLFGPPEAVVIRITRGSPRPCEFPQPSVNGIEWPQRQTDRQTDRQTHTPHRRHGCCPPLCRDCLCRASGSLYLSSSWPIRRGPVDAHARCRTSSSSPGFGATSNMMSSWPSRISA